MRSTPQYLDSPGLRIIVLAEVPRAGFNAPTSLSQALAHGRPTQGRMLQRNLLLTRNVREA